MSDVLALQTLPATSTSEGNNGQEGAKGFASFLSIGCSVGGSAATSSASN